MKTRVLMVLESMFPMRSGGGVEGQVRTLGGNLVERGVSVSLLVPMVPYGKQVSTETVDGIEVTRIAYPKVAKLGTAVMLVRLALRLFRTRNTYTTIHAHVAGNMAAVCCVMGFLLRKRVLVKLTGMSEMVGGILDPRPSLMIQLRKAALRRATYYQATSSQIARMLVQSGFAAEKIHRIPNAVNTQRFESAQRDESLRRQLCGNKSLVGIFVGRLEQEKDLDILLTAWSAAFAQTLSTSLVIIGAGTMMSALKALARQLGIGQQVVFVGPSDSVERYMAMADVGLLTSRAEGLSNTLLEYMASGLPVIGSRISGTEDFVDTGKAGWLFTAGDVVQLKECLLAAAALARDQLAALGENAKRLVTSEASIAVVVNRLIRLYEA